VWIAEVMAQQTRLETVVPYYRRFLARWPSLAALADAPEEEVLAAWAGLGYYARARNLVAAARLAQARHGGLPASREALRALPGFGPYTAGAVASIAFALPAPAVDGNALRVLSRWGGFAGAPAAVRRRVGALASALATGDRPGDVNQAVMELGATTCAPRRPRCAACPIARGCAGRGRAAPRSAAPRPRVPPPELRLALALVARGGELLLERRPRRGLFGGMWGPPAAEVAPGEDPRRALRTALRARLGVRAEVGPAAASLVRALTHRTLVLSVHPARLAGRPGRAGEPGGDAGLRWAARRDIQGLAVPTALRRALEAAGEGPHSPSRGGPGADRPGSPYPAERP
jgi:A/G-specific adenine glycosylase